MAHASQLLLPHGPDIHCVRRRHQPNQIPHHLPGRESFICARFISAAHILSFNALNRLFMCASIIIQCVHVHVFLIASCIRSLTLMKMLYRLEWIHTELRIFALKMLSCLQGLSVVLLSKPVCFWGSNLVSIPKKLRPLCGPTAFRPTLWTKDKAHDVKAWLSGTLCVSGFVYHYNVLYLALNPAEFTCISLDC